MIIKLQVIDDTGEVKAEATGPAWQPVQWKAPPSFPIIIKRPGDNGHYKLFSITAQPICTLVLGAGQNPVQFPK